MAGEARYRRSERGKHTLIYCGFEFCRHRLKAHIHVACRCSKCIELSNVKPSSRQLDYNVVGTTDMEHNHEGNFVSTALAKRATGENNILLHMSVSLLCYIVHVTNRLNMANGSMGPSIKYVTLEGEGSEKV